jgi:hypothetical protein
VGTDRILVGTSINAGPPNAYLFNTNGTLLNTFTNPIAGTERSFSQAVGVLSENRLLIRGNGRLHLFTTNGVLLTTYTNSGMCEFGSIATLGSDRILIDGSCDDTAGLDTGAVYLVGVHTLDPPSISIQRTNGSIRLDWPLSAAAFLLEQTTNLFPVPSSNTWSQVAFPYETNGGHISISQPTAAPQTFYRLRKP